MNENPDFLSYRDPENSACRIDGTWFRIASSDSATAMRILRNSGLYQELTAAGSIVSFDELDSTQSENIRQRIAGFWPRAVTDDVSVFSVQTIPTITYPWEWPNSLLASAARLTLKLRQSLLDLGLDLKDASAFNVQFVGSAPIFMDLGSLQQWRPNPSWNASRQFIEHFINPLAVGHSGFVAAADVWLLSRGKGTTSSVARSLMSGRLRRRPGLLLLQAATKPVARNQPSEVHFRDAAESDSELALRATRSLTSRLRKHVDKLDGQVHRTTWANYGAREHYAPDDLARKMRMASDFIRDCQADAQGLVLDVGGNDGLTAREVAVAEGVPVIVLDVDAGALDQLAQVLTVRGTSDILTPIVGDFTNLTPSSGLLNKEFDDFRNRIRPSAVLCQAVLHHVVITQGIPLPLAIAALADFGAPLHIEFADVDDSKVQLLIGQIPNWQGEYSVDSLISALKDRYADVRIVGRTSPTRVIVEARRLRHGDQGAVRGD